MTWENLLPHEESGLRFMEIRYAPGANSGGHMLRHPGRDLFVVLAGELVFRVGFGEHRLAAGDSISFVLSLGKPEVEVPYVVGSLRKEARQTLADAGFAVRLQQYDSD